MRRWSLELAVQEVERMSYARDCADCGFLFSVIFAVAGDGGRLSCMPSW